MHEMLSTPRTVLRGALLAALGLLTPACADITYFAHVTRGQLAIAHARAPLDRVDAAPTTDAKLAARLRLARDARRFAIEHLGLPDNRSYTTYVDLHRPYVVWNVFAAPRYSIDPVLHCFPIAGCVPYRGYFDEAKAKKAASTLEADGNDVFVGGVAAYSTLGWFADPILSSMLRWDDDELSGTIFHELAHQRIYVKDDTTFNESFATFVQREGLREWRAARGLSTGNAEDERHDDEFVRLVLELRERLRVLYAGLRGSNEVERSKRREFEDFRSRYAAWRDSRRPADHTRDAFVASPLNNATLLPFGLYDQSVPAFAALFREEDGNWSKFYERVRAIAAKTSQQRKQVIDGLLDLEKASPQFTPRGTHE